MRTLIIENNIINQSILDEGINLVKQDLASINFPIEITRQVSNKLFNTEVRPNGYWAIKTTDIAPMGVGYNFSFLIYDATKVCPTQPDMSLFHPEEYGNVMQMSCQWFNNSSRVFADFFLHEIAHMLQQGKKDLTHLIVDRNLDPNLYDTLKVGQMQHKDFYLYLIKNNSTHIVYTPRTLKKGMTGTDVMNLQKDLRTLGYFTYPINTLYFGSVTDKTVKDFQKANGLVIDGICGRNTFAKIELLKKKPNGVTITRISDNGIETLGELVAYKDGKEFRCKTIELAWKENKNSISCIPKGTYEVAMSLWSKKNKNYYLLKDVPSRSGIFIHEGNYHYNYEGCIGLGKDFADINKDGQTDITSTVATLKAFEKFMNKEPFTLTIQ